MSTITHRVDDREASGVTSRDRLSATSTIAAVLALAGLVVGIAGAHSRGDAPAYAAAVLVGAWAAATVVVAFRRPAEALPVWLAVATLAGAAALASDRRRAGRAGRAHRSRHVVRSVRDRACSVRRHCAPRRPPAGTHNRDRRARCPRRRRLRRRRARVRGDSHRSIAPHARTVARR